MRLARFIQKDYPYVNARVSAKGAKLLDRSDYENLLKMEPNEIARRLEEGEYKEEINELGSHLDGVELVETALQMNAANTLVHLTEMSPESLQKVLEIYTRRYDIQSLKRILRAKKAGDEEFTKTLTPGATYSIEELEELAEKDFDQIVDEIEFEGTVDYQEYLEEAEELTEIEKALDQAYIDELSNLSKNTGSLKLSGFVKDEIEYENLRIILRLKKYGVDEEDIREKVFSHSSNSIVEDVLDTESFEDAVEVLQDSDWEIDPSSDLEEIEHQLDVHRLRKARTTLSSSQLGIASIMAYIVAKMIEVKNLRTMIQAKATGIQSNEEIRENLVISNGR